jgi:hypothetical protein
MVKSFEEFNRGWEPQSELEIKLTDKEISVYANGGYIKRLLDIIQIDIKSFYPTLKFKVVKNNDYKLSGPRDDVIDWIKNELPSESFYTLWPQFKVKR